MIDEPARGIKKKRPIPQPGQIEIAPMPGLDQEQRDKNRTVLPKVTPGKNMGRQLSSIQKIEIKKIEFEGLTVFTKEQLGGWVDSIEGKTVSFDDLNNLRHKLSELYLDQGYINSGVLIPDQKIEKGVVTFRVIEGELTAIEIEGLENLDNAYVENIIRNTVDVPLNIKDLSEALKLLKQDKLISPGESVLRVLVKEATPFYYSLGVDNYISPSVGANRVSINLGHANLFGYADQLDVDMDFTEGLSGANLSYDIPITRAGSRLKFYGDYRDYIAVEAPFDQIDIESNSSQYGFAYAYPFRKRLNEELFATIGFEVKHSESTLLKQPFSFSLGAINGKSDVSVLEATASWVKRHSDKVFSAYGALRLGVPVLDATENKGDLPDGEFTLFKGQLQYAQLLGFANSQLLLRSGFQMALDPLLSMEKFAVGGRYSVRGYRENQFVRDNGITATLEWRLPIILGKEDRNEFQMVSFIDTGTSWDKNEELSKTTKESISSVGLGLLWDPTPNWHAELFYANALKDLPEVSDPGLQDKGVHFQIHYQSGF